MNATTQPISGVRSCYRCGRAIMKRAVLYVPPNYMIAMGADFPKAFHALCYAAEQRQAKREFDRTQGGE